MAEVKVDLYPKPDFWTPSIRLHGDTGWIYSGSDTTGTEGRLILTSNKGSSEIVLASGAGPDMRSGPGPAMVMRDSSGKDSIVLDGAKGDIILGNADCAEDFDMSQSLTIEPGTVLVIDQEGKLRQSELAYDKKVAGVLSGAHDYRPGIVLDRKPSRSDRKSVSLVGKVYCKADAQYEPIEVGDLLTTSPTPGYAMKAVDPLKAFGAVIGKALHPLTKGKALIPILIALQ